MGKTTPYAGGNALSVSGQDTITLSGGTYYFTSVSTSGQGAISVTGPSTIYVDGNNINISGQGFVNTAQLPKDLLIYFTGSTINISGQAAFYGGIYAPSATVTLSGQENLYGSVICGSDVDSGQAAIHFDIDLLKSSPLSVGIVINKRISSWQETK